MYNSNSIDSEAVMGTNYNEVSATVTSTYQAQKDKMQHSFYKLESPTCHVWTERIVIPHYYFWAVHNLSYTCRPEHPVITTCVFYSSIDLPIQNWTIECVTDMRRFHTTWKRQIDSHLYKTIHNSCTSMLLQHNSLWVPCVLLWLR